MQKVLLVEDCACLRRTLMQLLRNDYNVVTACDGKEGYDVWVRENPDFIITDYNMPNLTGEQMTAVIQEKDPSAKIIAFTSDPSLVKEERRFFSVVKKPDFNTLSRTIKLLIGEPVENIKSKVHNQIG